MGVSCFSPCSGALCTKYSVPFVNIKCWQFCALNVQWHLKWFLLNVLWFYKVLSILCSTDTGKDSESDRVCPDCEDRSWNENTSWTQAGKVISCTYFNNLCYSILLSCLDTILTELMYDVWCMTCAGMCIHIYVPPPRKVTENKFLD